MPVLNNGDTLATKLDTIRFPLHGARLIEASAGTGKTFTITGLYLRLLLGHGSQPNPTLGLEESRHTAHQRPLTVDEILVVTFTEAATAELRGRIRNKIRDAKLAFMNGNSDDPVISALLEATQDHHQAAQTLLAAERQMDEAAIYTIHGFCQRMLVQNAFESGSRFNNEFLTDESKLKQQVVADFWRHSFYSLDRRIASIIRQIWSSPQGLYNEIHRYITNDTLSIAPAIDTVDIAQLHAAIIHHIETMKAQWLSDYQDAMANLRESGVSKQSYSSRHLPVWIEAATQWAQSPTEDYTVFDKLEKFTQSTLSEKTKKGQAPDHPLFSHIEAFLEQDLDLKIPLMSCAINHCREALKSEKQRQQLLSFDDLLSQLNHALHTDSGDTLAARIRTLYPVAMIDEFQDTDAQQYDIFKRVYLDQPHCGWFMIGDPKQAIYGFRGADIFTYIEARKQVTSHFTLDTNWRSSHDMIAAANGLFEFGINPFIYDQDIPFIPVAASPNADQRGWTLNDQAQPALNVWVAPDREQPISNADYKTQMAQATAAQIQLILEQAQCGRANLHSEKHTRPIEASDIAILVRTGAEGRLIKHALAQQGIASVYMSNRDSVFKSAVAQDMYRVMDSLLGVDNERKLRAALATGLLDVSVEQLHQLGQDEVLWERTVSEFALYREQWQKQGILPMFRSLMNRREIAQRWVSEVSQDGERKLTDFMHLSELLQQHSQMLESDHALLRWFGEAIDNAHSGEAAADDQILRLESEKDLVQIVTIHKSKGLEYDLVFLPFIMGFRQASDAKYYDPEHAKSVLDLAKGEQSLERADTERLAEDLRLLYVAMTRSVYGCFVGVAPVKKGNQTKGNTGVHLSAMGYLLQQRNPMDCTGFYQSMAQFFQSLLPQTTRQASILELSPTPFVLSETEEFTAKPATLSHTINNQWRMTSYSGLVKQSQHGHATISDLELTIPAFDLDSAREEQIEQDELIEQSMFSFPRGARPGTLLHTIFEEIDFTEPNSDDNQIIVAQLLEREGITGDWLPVVMDMVSKVLSADLSLAQPSQDHLDCLKLCDKNAQHTLVEMEFVLPLELLSATQFNQIVRRHDALSKQADNLEFRPAQGMLKGFIDLIFEHQGKYYVLDWKSNHLGNDNSDYHQQALQQAMLDHRYDMQYQIYSLALHRFLRQRIANYSYEQHFGGVYYLFLRGIDGQSNNGIFYTKPSETLLDELDAHIADNEEAL
ncbi:exodeoxyribonuclease V subunit beta [Vibrio sp. qd031]|uniref:exodeoxyribonuclease V subunit beta n=1 Tax=Vibrio sp. qd031 TaxID=1603038 RepID=UPI000A107684|nr:exodeoxyribonuclease V subunit beta [Vibrio sp. qd031]ORT49238.1 exodeoxyribonuclease V subunit beta [Vibrio sp. qd031]